MTFLNLVGLKSVFADEIRLGMSAPFTGPNKELGINLLHGAQTYFDRYNQTPAGKENTIKLIAYDDGYEPNRTIDNTLKLINQDKVFALFNYVGTPTSKAIIPLVKRFDIPYFFPFTGAEFLRWPAVEQVFNFRGSYYQEAETLVNYFVKSSAIKKASLFIQADAFGISASQGYIRALNNRWITDISQVRYRRNSLDISQSIAKIKAQKPDVILCVATYHAVSTLINQLRQDGIETPVATLSFTGAEELKSHLTNFDNVYISTVFPHPTESELPIIQQYREDMAGKAFNHESLEGYLNAKLFTEIIKVSNKPLSHENLIKAAENNTFDIGGISITYSESNHSTLLPITLNQITKEKLVEIPPQK